MAASLLAAALLGVAACNRADADSPATVAAAPGVDSANPAADRAAWHKPPEDEIRRRLSPLQFAVTQQDATEPPFRNEYWDNHAPGLYVDVVSGEPLFASTDKFESGTGWPSFTKPVAASAVTTRTDWKLVLPRTEVRSAIAGSHLGHVFDDGPAPTGKRFCMNSAALRFVPVDRLAADGYGAWLPLFVNGDSHADRGVAPAAAAPAGSTRAGSAPAQVAEPTGNGAVPRENPPRPTPPDR